MNTWDAWTRWRDSAHVGTKPDDAEPGLGIVLDERSNLFVEESNGFVLIPQPPRSIDLLPCKGLGYGQCRRLTLRGRSCKSCHEEYIADPDAFK